MILLHPVFTLQSCLFFDPLGLQLLLDLADLRLLPVLDLLLLLDQILLHVLHKSWVNSHNSWIIIDYLSLNVPIKGSRDPHHHFLAE